MILLASRTCTVALRCCAPEPSCVSHFLPFTAFLLSHSLSSGAHRHSAMVHVVDISSEFLLASRTCTVALRCCAPEPSLRESFSFIHSAFAHTASAQKHIATAQQCMSFRPKGILIGFKDMYIYTHTPCAQSSLFAAPPPHGHDV